MKPVWIGTCREWPDGMNHRRSALFSPQIYFHKADTAQMMTNGSERTMTIRYYKTIVLFVFVIIKNVCDFMKLMDKTNKWCDRTTVVVLKKRKKLDCLIDVMHFRLLKKANETHHYQTCNLMLLLPKRDTNNALQTKCATCHFPHFWHSNSHLVLYFRLYIGSKWGPK